MEVWFDGSADGRRGAWAALILEGGRKPRLIYGTARDVPTDTADRWAARQVLRRLGSDLPDTVLVVSDRRDNVSHPVSKNPALVWAWRSRRHPLIQQLDAFANRLRRGLPLPAAA